jgi:hypothetical protein
MATTYSWGYTNSTASLKSVTQVALGLKTNYGLAEDSANQCLLSNITSPIDQPEVIRYDFEKQKVSVSDLANPPKSRDGVRYVCTLKDIYRETRDNGDVYDHPFQISISIKHDTSVNWTNALVAAELARAISGLYNETDGDWRFESLMRSALEPQAD